MAQLSHRHRDAIIVDVEPTPARTYDEVEFTKTMLERTERRFGLKPKRLAADTAYGTGRFLAGWLAAGLYRTSGPRASERDDGTFSRSDFRWDRRRGVYVCPTTSCYTPPVPCTTHTLRFRNEEARCFGGLGAGRPVRGSVGGRAPAPSRGGMFARMHQLLHAVIWHRLSCAPAACHCNQPSGTQTSRRYYRDGQVQLGLSSD